MKKIRGDADERGFLSAKGGELFARAEVQPLITLIYISSKTLFTLNFRYRRYPVPDQLPV
jgi:hypothetical protein